MEETKELLVAVTGQSPAIVTETLYALTRGQSSPRRIREVHLICTATSRETARQILLGHGGALACLAQAVGNDCVPAGEHVHLHALEDGDGHALPDVRTSADNEQVAIQIIRLVRELVDRSDILHASVAGGRKTMGLCLALALQLCGRPQDRLYHVLVPEEQERDRGFFFPKAGSSIRVDLAELPFVRLREHLPDLGVAPRGLSRVVATLQARLDERVLPRLIIRGRGEELRIQVGEQTVQCGKRDARLWACFARRRRDCTRQGAVGCACCFLKPEDLPDEWAPWTSIRRTLDIPVEDRLEGLRNSFRQANSRIKKALVGAGLRPQVVELCKIGGACPADHGERMRYGIALPPDRIALDAD